MKTTTNSITSKVSRHSQSRALILPLAASLALLAFAANAADIQWQGGTASYTNAADWVSNAVPGINDNAINDNGTNNVVQINAGDPDWLVKDIRAGNAGGTAGAFEQNGPTVTCTNAWFRLGLATNSFGVYTLNAGTLHVNGGRINVGELGTGLLVINGGVISKSGDHFAVSDGGFSGSAQPSYGTVIQNGGTVNSTSEIWIGQFGDGVNIGTGVYDLHSNATLNINNWFAIGRSGGHGTLNMDGGVINKGGGGDFLVGTGFSTPSGGSGVAVINQSGGTINCNNGSVLVPESAPSTGTYNMSGNAALVFSNWLAVGRNNGTGYLNMNGGSITKAGGSGSHLDIGASGVGTLNQSNGVITSLVSDTWLGESGAGTWNLEGGSAILGKLVFCVNGSANGTLNLDGGLLQVSGINSPSSLAVSVMNFNGGTLRASADNSDFMSGLSAVGVGSGGAVIDSNGHDITIPQEIDDNGGGTLTKLGAGTLTLTGFNGYSGDTLVNEGTLMVGSDSSASGNYIVADNAGFGVVVQSAGAELFADQNVTLGSSTGASLNFDLGYFGNPSSAPLYVSGILTVNGTVTVNIADSVPQVGEFPLIQYQSGGLAGSGNFVLVGLPSGVAANLKTNTSNNSIDLVITKAGPSLRWDGLVTGGVWDIDTTSNWYDMGSSMASVFLDGNAALFNDAASGTTTVDLEADVHPSSLIFTNDYLPYTLVGTGKISGTIALNKEGASSLEVLNTGGNDYSGPTVISGGTLTVTNLANGGSPSPIGASTADQANLVIGGGTFSYAGAPVTVNRGFTLAATNATIDAEGNLTLGGSVAVAAGLSGKAFIKTGPGELALTGSGDNEFASGHNPGLRVDAGTLLLDGSAGNQTNDVASGDMWVGGTRNSGASLILSNTTLNVAAWLGLGRGNGTVSNVSTMTLYNSSVSFGNVSLGFWNNIAGNLASQFLTLNGNSSLIDHGDMNLAESGGSTATVNINGTSFLSSQNRCYLGGNSGNSHGSMTVADSGQFKIVNGWFSIGNGDGSTGSLLIKDNASVSVSSDFNVTDVGAGTATAVVEGNARLNANNLWVGKDNNTVAVFTITNNATVMSTNGLTMATFFNGTPVAPATAVVNLGGGSLAVNLIQGNSVSNVNYGVFNFNGGNLIFHGPYFGGHDVIFSLQAANVLAGGANIEVDNSDSVQVSQPLLDGGGGGGLTKTGSGTLRLNGANTYTGGTLVSEGSLGGTGTIAGPVNVASGATLAPGTDSIGTLTIANSLTFSNSSSAYFKFSLDGGATNNDQVAGLTNVAYAGTLVVSNVGTNALAVGDKFHLFSAATATGNFSSVTVLPQGSGTFDPATGVLTITAVAPFAINTPVISNGNLALTGTGGTAGSSYTILTTTNLALPLADWETNTTGTFDGLGEFSNNIPLNTLEPGRYFSVRTP